MGTGAKRWGLGLLLLAAGGVGSSAAAEPISAPDTKLESVDTDYNALFQQSFARPLDLDLAFHLAQVATQRGDYEAAIGALERMLFYNPNLPRVRLELGVLYFKLGSYAMARSYFMSAIARPDAPPEVKEKVNQFLAEIDRRLSPHQLTAFFQSGFRYQTNANAGPNGLLVKAIGQDAVLNSQFAKAPDWNWFGLVGINYAYELQNGNGDALEVGLTGYDAQQFRFRQFDLGLVEIQAGPRLGFRSPLIPGASLKFYGIGTAVNLAEAPYYSGLGGGVSTRLPLGVALIEPSVEFRPRRFEDSSTYPTASQLTGTLVTTAVVAEVPLPYSLALAVRGAYDSNRTSDPAFGFNSYNRWAADAALPIPWNFDWKNFTLHLVVAPTAGVSRTPYAMPNPIVSPTVTRLDREWHVGIIFDVSPSATFGIRTQVQYSRTDSTLPNYDTRNLSITFGPTARF
jgi:tetratricopeptide (TPR) repeat protein